MNTTQIKWTSKKVRDSIGLTHRTEVTIAGARYTFAVDQPRKGQWIARGWRDGDLFYYRDEPSSRTLAGAKAGVERQIGELLIAAAEKQADEAWTDLAEVSRQDEAAEDEPESDSVAADMAEGMKRFNAWAGDVSRAMSGMGRHLVDTMNEMTRLFRTAFYRPPCGCPTPTHRMSCGVGAVPRVVSS